MRLYCKACNNELTGTLIPAAPEQAYSKELTDPEFDIHKYRMLPGLFYKDTRPVCWSHDETTGDSTPSGDVKDYHAVAEQSLTGAKLANESKGCCGAELGWGGNDCWQDDKVLIESATVYEDESK